MVSYKILAGRQLSVSTTETLTHSLLKCFSVETQHLFGLRGQDIGRVGNAVENLS